MKLRVKKLLLYSGSNDIHPTTKRTSPISTKWTHRNKPNYSITIDFGKIGFFYIWKYQDYYSRKVPRK